MSSPVDVKLEVVPRAVANADRFGALVSGEVIEFNFVEVLRSATPNDHSLCLR